MMEQTPYYLIDEKKLRANLQLMKDLESEAGIKILIALKAFSFWSAFNIVQEYFPDGAASSYNEARLIHEELGGSAHTYATVFNDEDFDDICKYSDHLIFNSVNQFAQFKKRALEQSISIGLRVNPEWSDVKTEIYNPATPNSRLGVTAEILGDFWDPAIEGLHFHVLSESNSYSLETAFHHFENKFGQHLHKLKWINLGGGHLITAEDYDIPHLIQLLKRIKEKYNVDVILEPGAAFVLQAGTLVSKVEDIVQNGQKKIALLDISFTCHMPDTLEMPFKPIVANEVSHSDYKYILGGTSCLAGDFIDGFYFENELAIGDVLEFQDMLQYTLVQTKFFNGVKHPAVVLKNIDGEKVLLRKYNYSDFKNKC